jgi:large subunit ribosomal protein L15
MELHTLKPATGSTKNRKVIARGQGSGHGGTSTRGHKGAKSRSGYSKKNGFEGGQMPIQRRVPKFGFKNVNRVEYKVVNLSDIQKLVDSKSILEFDSTVFADNGLTSSKDLIKVLAKGELKSKVTVKANAFSQKAIDAISSLGGLTEKI